MNVVTIILAFTLAAAIPSSATAEEPAGRELWSVTLPDELQQTIHALQESLNTWNVDGMKTAVETLQARPATMDEDERYLRTYWLGTAAFHVALALGENDQSDGKRATVFELLAVEALQNTLECRPDERDVHAMLAVLHGLAIRRNVFRALFLGRDQRRHYRAAHEALDDNPRVVFLKGVSRLKRARSREDLEEAAGLLERAAGLYALETDEEAHPLAPRWGYGPTLLFMGEVSEELGRYDEAAAWFQKAARIMPESERVRKGYER